MKRVGYLLVIFILLFTISVYALHDARVTLTSPANPRYETTNVFYNFGVENRDINFPPINDPINSINILTNGVVYLDIFNSPPWLYTNTSSSINWDNSAISAGGSQSFMFNSFLNKVDKDESYTWTVTTNDSNGDTNVTTFTINVLNDSVNPSVTINSPVDYGFVKSGQFDFNLGVSDAETGIDTSQNSKIGYKDNNAPQNTLGVVYFNLSLSQGSGVLTGSFDTNTRMNVVTSPYLDFKIFEVYDKAGNPYVDSNTHHIYVDSDSPLVNVNFNSGLLTNNKAQTFSYDVSDNSFETKGKLSFAPGLKCTLSIDNNANKIYFYTNNASNSVIAPDLNLIADGNHDLNYNCVDNATYSTSVSNQFTLDTTGPSITLTAPSNGSLIRNETQLNFTVTDALAGVSSVWYEFNNTNITLSNPYSITPLTWPDGVNNIRIYANDTLNNLNTVFYTFTVDNTPPVIQIIKPLGELTNSTINLVFNATDDVSSSLSCTYVATDIFSSALGVPLFTVDSSNLVSKDIQVNTGGSWLISIACKDSAGNIGNAGTAADIDLTAPTVTLNTPLDNSIFNYSNLIFEYGATDTNAVKECNLYLENNNNLTDLNSFTNFTQSLAEGNHNWYIRCKDSVDNLGMSGTRTLLVDTIKPNMTLNYDKLKLEKQLDSITTSYSISEINKVSSSLKVQDSGNNKLAEISTENTNLQLSGLSLGAGNFTINVYANDTVGNSDSQTLNFEVVDTLVPIILSSTPVNGSNFGSLTSNVNLTLTTDETAKCRLTTNSSLSYANMVDMGITNSKLHSEVVNVNAGNTYNYYFVCSDGSNTMNTNYNIIFSVDQAVSSSSNSGGGGGGGSSTIRKELPKPLVVNTEQPKINPVVNPEQNPQETNKQNTNTEQPKTENSPSPLTGLSIFNGIAKYRKQALVSSAILSLGLLGSFGVVRFRRYKLSKMHRPPFNNNPPLEQTTLEPLEKPPLN